jgi:hypothetical protein
MLCFPAVLFAGAVLPVSAMGLGGKAISIAMIARWAFEGAGHDLGLAPLLAADGSGHGATLMAQYDGTFAGGSHWVPLVGFAAAFLLAAGAVVRRRASAS